MSMEVVSERPEESFLKREREGVALVGSLFVFQLL